MFRKIRYYIKAFRLFHSFAKQCEQLLDDLNGKRVDNFIEIEVLHPETNQRYWFTIRRAKGLSPAAKCSILETRIQQLETLLEDANVRTTSDTKAGGHRLD